MKQVQKISVVYLGALLIAQSSWALPDQRSSEQISSQPGFSSERVISAQQTAEALVNHLNTLPSGYSVISGDVTFSSSAGNLTIHASDQAIINFDSFNIGASETVTIVQPSSSAFLSITSTQSPSIQGSLFANGGFTIVNGSAGSYLNSSLDYGHILTPIEPTLNSSAISISSTGFNNFSIIDGSAGSTFFTTITDSTPFITFMEPQPIPTYDTSYSFGSYGATIGSTMTMTLSVIPTPQADSEPTEDTDLLSVAQAYSNGVLNRRYQDERTAFLNEGGPKKDKKFSAAKRRRA